MKYTVVLGDGMADWKIPELGGKTCLEAAATPTLDRLAKTSETGLCKTVPDGYKPGSDVANMSVLGFNPESFYTGRSPLEAVSMGISLNEDDVTLRCNLVTLSDGEPFGDKVMLDYSAGDISTEEAKILIDCLNENLNFGKGELFAGAQYRHCLVMRGGAVGANLTPPHDITGKPVGKYLPKGVNAGLYKALTEQSYKLLSAHPVNLKRIKEGKKPANSIWLWGEGTKPKLEKFEKLRRKKGGIISAVDLIKGLGMLADMKIISVSGATGNYDTDFAGKANAAADELLSGLDFVYIHVEAPDECGHHGDFKHKVYSIEKIDGIVKIIAERLGAAGEDFALLVCPDHPTPCEIKTHTSDPVPYLLYSTAKNLSNGAARYTEDEAKKTGEFVPQGYKLIEKLFAL